MQFIIYTRKYRYRSSFVVFVFSSYRAYSQNTKGLINVSETSISIQKNDLSSLPMQQKQGCKTVKSIKNNHKILLKSKVKNSKFDMRRRTLATLVK